jgi:hypothetical protein
VTVADQTKRDRLAEAIVGFAIKREGPLEFGERRTRSFLHVDMSRPGEDVVGHLGLLPGRPSKNHKAREQDRDGVSSSEHVSYSDVSAQPSIFRAEPHGLGFHGLPFREVGANPDEILLPGREGYAVGEPSANAFYAASPQQIAVGRGDTDLVEETSRHVAPMEFRFAYLDDGTFFGE